MGKAAGAAGKAGLVSRQLDKLQQSFAESMKKAAEEDEAEMAGADDLDDEDDEARPSPGVTPSFSVTVPLGSGCRIVLDFMSAAAGVTADMFRLFRPLVLTTGLITRLGNEAANNLATGS